MGKTMAGYGSKGFSARGTHSSCCVRPGLGQRFYGSHAVARVSVPHSKALTCDCSDRQVDGFSATSFFLA